MKTFLFNLLLIAIFISAKTQTNQTSGIVIYEEVLKMEINIEGDASAFSDMIPNEIKNQKELVFSPEATLFRNFEEEADVNELMNEDEGGITIVMDGPDNTVFSDLNEKTTVEKREFMSRVFLIEGEMNSYDWKITGKQKTILGYPCQEATTTIDSSLVTVWFTPVIPVSSGPSLFGGLPGLILELNRDEGNQVIIAQEIEFKDISKDELQIPRKGKKVTREEYDRIVAEKIKEQGGQPGEHKMMMIEIKQ
jgi:GLPGLI family protein